jgi:hypothetical protein
MEFRDSRIQRNDYRGGPIANALGNLATQIPNFGIDNRINCGLKQRREITASFTTCIHLWLAMGYLLHGGKLPVRGRNGGHVCRLFHLGYIIYNSLCEKVNGAELGGLMVLQRNLTVTWNPKL